MATFIDGFEQFDGDRTAALMRMAGYSVGGVTLAAGRKGNSRSVSCYRATLSRAWSMVDNLLTLGFAVKFDQRGPLLSVGSGANQLYLWVDPETGLVNLGTGLAAGTPGYINPLKNRWYYFELQLDKSTSKATLFVNGKQDISIPLPSFITGNLTVLLNPFQLFVAPKEDYGTRLYDDLYLNDGPRLGPIQVTSRFATADGSKTGWSFDGAATRWQAVSPPINELDKFIYTAIDGNENSFISGTSLPDNNPIRYLQLVTLFRKATSDPMSLDFNIGSQVKRESNISRDWTFRYTMMSASGYDADSIKAAEFGVKLILG
ncbi:hypothetical protein [Cronobacter phage JC01]|uniref:Uncharacterized protein n=1 Tax=Cronobacter phage JC01 TaxID=2729575 RepID=A0A6M3YLM2_9CAUD|nr:hypothetical protein JT331_gp30 [Cronobacter phage JC01]QJI52249.1 hypothetical protein [Cronobacter phage JC01]